MPVPSSEPTYAAGTTRNAPSAFLPAKYPNKGSYVLPSKSYPLHSFKTTGFSPKTFL